MVFTPSCRSCSSFLVALLSEVLLHMSGVK
jgi:hypothetical protein